MPVTSSASLIDVLRAGHLLAPAQLDEITQTLLGRFPEPRALAKELMQRDWLTAYQVNQLLQGFGKDLLLGQYVILIRLADTSVGQVFKAQHHHMKRLVALTVVRESLLARPENVERFYLEIQAASQLTHPHVLCAFDAGPVGRTHFFAMEYAEGIDLERLVEQSGPVPLGPAVNFIRQAALGLQHAFERRLLHHDLKPANLLVTRLGGHGDSIAARKAETPPPGPEVLGEAQIKICNLGLTLLQPRSRHTNPDASVTGDVLAQNSLDYFAPETAQGAPLNDVRSNLYSLGCIFYYLLAGRPPFVGGNSGTKLKQHRDEEPSPIQSLRPELPEGIAEVVHKLLAKRPEARFQTPAELAGVLGELLGPDGVMNDTWPDTGAIPARDAPPVRKKSRVGVAPPGVPTTSAQQGTAPQGRLDRRKVRLSWLIGGAVVLVAVLAIASAVFLRGGSGETENQGGAASTEPSQRVVAPVVGRRYKKMATRDETIRETLRLNGLPTLEGKWWFIGPFDNTNKRGFDVAFAPETEIELAKSYAGKNGETVTWKEFPDFRPDKIIDLRRFKNNDWIETYLYHELESAEPASLPVNFGSDDTIKVWLNGKLLVAQNEYRGCAPGQAHTELHLRKGKNQLLLKVGNGVGNYQVYVSYPSWPNFLDADFGPSLRRDFPR